MNQTVKVLENVWHLIPNFGAFALLRLNAIHACQTVSPTQATAKNAIQSAHGSVGLSVVRGLCAHRLMHGIDI